MTWIRLRTWVGEHPTMAITLGLALWYVPLSIALTTLAAVGTAFIPDLAALILLLAALLLTPLVLFGWPCLVSLLRVRSGLPVLAPWRIVLLLWLLLALLAMPPLVAGLLRGGLGWAAIPAAAVLAVVLGFLQAGLAAWLIAIGHWIGFAVGRRRIEQGRWETTQPADETK